MKGHGKTMDTSKTFHHPTAVTIRFRLSRLQVLIILVALTWLVTTVLQSADVEGWRGQRGKRIGPDLASGSMAVGLVVDRTDCGGDGARTSWVRAVKMILSKVSARRTEEAIQQIQPLTRHWVGGNMVHIFIDDSTWFHPSSTQQIGPPHNHGCHAQLRP